MSGIYIIVISFNTIIRSSSNQHMFLFFRMVWQLGFEHLLEQRTHI